MKRITYIQNNGKNLTNIGFGTRNPEHKLNIHRTIKARGGICTSYWADFVFDDNFNPLTNRILSVVLLLFKNEFSESIF